MTPYLVLLAGLALVLILSKPFLKTWARRRAPEGTFHGYQRSYRWAAVMSGVLLVTIVLLVVFR